MMKNTLIRCALSVTLWVVICALLICNIAIRLTHAQDSGVPANISAHQFFLLGDSNQITAKWSALQGDSPSIRLVDSRGADKLLLSTRDTLSLVSLFNPNGQTSMLQEDGMPFLMAFRGGDRQGIEVSAGNEADYDAIYLRDPQFMLRTFVGLSEHQEAQLAMRDTKAHQTVLVELGILPLTSEDPVFFLDDASH